MILAFLCTFGEIFRVNFMGNPRVKEVTVHQMDGNGEILATEKTREVFRDTVSINFILLNMTYCMPYILAMKHQGELELLILISSYTNKFNNFIYVSPELKADLASMLGFKDTRAINKRLAHLESINAICKVAPNKYLISPDLFVFGGSKNYEIAKRDFDKNIKPILNKEF